MFYKKLKNVLSLLKHTVFICTVGHVITWGIVIRDGVKLGENHWFWLHGFAIEAIRWGALFHRKFSDSLWETQATFAYFE